MKDKSTSLFTTAPDVAHYTIAVSVVAYDAQGLPLRSEVEMRNIKWEPLPSVTGNDVGHDSAIINEAKIAANECARRLRG